MNTSNIFTSLASTKTKQFGKGLLLLRLPATLGADLIFLGVLATICMCAALALNQLREPPLPLVYAPKQVSIERAMARTTVAEVTLNAANPSNLGEVPQIIGLEEFSNMVLSKRGVVLDTRPEIFHRLGHVPGALSLPREEFKQDYARLCTLLEPQKGELIAVYCSSASCEDSEMVADNLVKLGYQHVLVFKGGWEVWTQAQLPKEKQ